MRCLLTLLLSSLILSSIATKANSEVVLSFTSNTYQSTPTIWAWVSGGSAISELEGYSWNAQQSMERDPISGVYQWRLPTRYLNEVESGKALNFIVNKADEFSRSQSGCYNGKRWYNTVDACINTGFEPYIGPYLTLTKQLSSNSSVAPVVLDPSTSMIVNFELKNTPSNYIASVEYRKSGTQQWSKRNEDSQISFGREWGIVHHITLQNLVSNTQYDYRLIGPNNQPSEVYSFKTAKRNSNESRFLIIGDMQDQNRNNAQRWADVAQTIVNDHLDDFDFIITVGDMVKDDVSENGDRFYWWKVFFNKGHDLFASKPMMPAMGNHDTPGVPDLIYKDGGKKWHEPYWSNAEDTRAFRKYFYMNPNMDFKDYYSFKYGNACFISGNSEIPVFYGRHPERPNSLKKLTDYNQWLESELTKASQCDWSFAYWHVPAINPMGGKNEVAFIRPYVDQFNGSLDWLFTGHVHEYQRLKPVEATEYRLDFNKIGYGRNANEGVGYLIAPPSGQFPRTNLSRDTDQLAFYPHNRHGVGYEIGFSIVQVKNDQFRLETYGMGAVGDQQQPRYYRQNDDRSKQLMDTVEYDKSKPKFRQTFDAVYFRGNDNNWTQSPMELVGDYLWEIVIEDTTDEVNPRFKFFANNKWYGDNEPDGETHSNEYKDIPLTSHSGSIRIRFDESKRRYWVTTE